MKKVFALSLCILVAASVYVFADGSGGNTPASNIIAYVLIGIGVAAIAASIIILKKKKGQMKKK